MNTTMTAAEVLTADDVVREGNIRVVLPWDGRVGEVWWDAARRLFGLAGLNAEQVPRRFLFHSTWADLKAHYARRGATVLRAPSGARVGDLVR